MLPVALDVMGGDFAPDQIIEGALHAQAEGIPVVLFGDPSHKAVAEAAMPVTKGNANGKLELVATTQSIAMNADPGPSVRTLKDASVVRAAEAVRDQQASAMVSAGNTGAAMASALLRMGRLRNVSRPAIAIPFPVYGRKQPNLLLDCGANAECQPAWLLQFAQMGAVHARDRFGVEKPSVGLLSIGEESGKGSSLVKKAYSLLEATEWQRNANCEFVGNVEGRDLLTEAADVIVTDGFTGNVMLKTSEGVARQLMSALLSIFEDSQEDLTQLLSALQPLYDSWNPDNTGGGVLLGVAGVCVISHGSSKADAIKHAIMVAHELVQRDTTKHLESALSE